jgi:phosphatidylinositol alpha-mannosyltransferase
VRIGLVCPYSWDIPGGVQAHVRDLAEKLLELGHSVSVLAPGDEDTPGLPPYVVVAGKAVPIPYNGSVARLQFGVVSAARVRRWLRDGAFDVVHVHEPAPPSLSLLTCMIHDGPLVATFHAATVRSRFLSMFDTVLQPFLEKITGRIAVSPAARKVIVEHLGGDAVVIPNGVAVGHYRAAAPLDGYPRAGGTIGFVGRYDEPRKGMDVLVDALGMLVPQRPELRLLIAGRGDADSFRAALPDAVAGHVELLGQVAAQCGRLLRAEHRAGELRRDPARGDGGRHRDRGQRHRGVPAGAGRRRGGAAVRGRRPGRAGRGADGRARRRGVARPADRRRPAGRRPVRLGRDRHRGPARLRARDRRCRRARLSPRRPSS